MKINSLDEVVEMLRAMKVQCQDMEAAIKAACGQCANGENAIDIGGDCGGCPLNKWRKEMAR